MSEQSVQSQNYTKLPPPSGDSETAEKYIHQLIDLINTEKLTVIHTDLSKFDPTTLADHYRLDLKDYDVEISHNKNPNTSADSYVMLFNNLKSINNASTEKVILAYIHLSELQFSKIKTVSDEQIERRLREAEKKRFKEAMIPVDQALEQLGASDNIINESSQTDNQAETDDNLSVPLDNTLPAFPTATV